MVPGGPLAGVTVIWPVGGRPGVGLARNVTHVLAAALPPRPSLTSALYSDVVVTARDGAVNM